MKTLIPLSISLVLCSISITSSGQDSLVFLNGNWMVGEIKNMDRGVLTIETDYSKKDFTIEWKGIKEIYTATTFLITLADGTRHSGSLRSVDGFIDITIGAATVHRCTLQDVVYLNQISNKFWDKIKASVSLGYSLTKAQNLKQFSLRSSVGLIEERWMLDFSFNRIRSTQDEVDPIYRSDGGVSFAYFLPKDWYIPISLTFLSNTEQQLDLRLLGKVGIGKYVIHKNNAYWGFSGGVSQNFENYFDDANDRNSVEGYIGTELNLFDIGDLSLLTRIMAYPSLTESGRLRTDYMFDAKYDLPLDFYVQLGLTVNYDNQPVDDAPKTDYVTQVTFGWKW